MVLAIKQILKTVSAPKSLKSQDPLQWPVVKQLMEHDIKTVDGDIMYQGSVLVGYSDECIERCKREAVADLERLTEKILSLG